MSTFYKKNWKNSILNLKIRLHPFKQLLCILLKTAAIDIQWGTACYQVISTNFPKWVIEVSQCQQPEKKFLLQLRRERFYVQTSQQRTRGIQPCILKTSHNFTQHKVKSQLLSEASGHMAKNIRMRPGQRGINGHFHWILKKLKK